MTDGELKRLSYETASPRHPGEVHYAVFPSAKSRLINGPICVFSCSPCTMPGTVNFAEEIVDGICEKEGLDWRRILFADLQTHHFGSLPRGYYLFEILHFGEDLGRNTKCNQVSSWNGIECPQVVFDAFQDLIGDFLTVEELVNRDKPEYRRMAHKRYKENLALSLDWAGRLERIYERERELHRDRFVPVDEAFSAGYRLAPLFVHAGAVPENIEADIVVVDLKDSHLLGQTRPGGGGDIFGRPHPFSFWLKQGSRRLGH